jgi:hypothetical protein
MPSRYYVASMSLIVALGGFLMGFDCKARRTRATSNSSRPWATCWVRMWPESTSRN